MKKKIFVIPFFGSEKDKVEVIDLHSDPVEGFEYYQKVMPSSNRAQVIESANANGTSELIEIVNRLILLQALLDPIEGTGVKGSDAGKSLRKAIEKITKFDGPERVRGIYPDGCVVCGRSPANYTNGKNSLCSEHKRYKGPNP